MLKRMTSMKTAITIMLLLIVTSILATFLPDFNIYQTIWYRGLLLFLCINLLFCTAKGLPMVFKNLKTIPTPNKNKFISGKKYKLENDKHFEKNTRASLTAQGYAVKISKFEQTTVISAHKGVINYLAPHVLHVALIIVFVGALLYSFGTTDNLYCYVGESVALPKEVMPTVKMRVDSFKTLYDHDGSIDNWQSKITLLKGSTPLISGSLKVNRPFEYSGVKFYQSGYGYDQQLRPYTILNVKRASGGSIIMFGLVIMAASSLFFWSGSYRKINIFIHRRDNIMQFNIYCKHKEIKEILTNQILQTIKGGKLC